MLSFLNRNVKPLFKILHIVKENLSFKATLFTAYNPSCTIRKHKGVLEILLLHCIIFLTPTAWYEKEVPEKP